MNEISPDGSPYWNPAGLVQVLAEIEALGIRYPAANPPITPATRTNVITLDEERRKRRERIDAT